MSFLEIAVLLSSRPVVVTFALVGATLSIVASIVPKKKNAYPDANAEFIQGQKTKTSQLLSMFGYAFFGLSVFLFILAGFIVDL